MAALFGGKSLDLGKQDKHSSYMRQNLPAITLCFDVEFHLMLYHLEDYPVYKDIV